MAALRVLVRIRGVVQGVGFRPFVYRLATELGLVGWVKNDDAGVLVEIAGDRWEEFLRRVEADSPPLARVRSVTWEPVLGGDESETRGFVVRASDKGAAVTSGVGPDAAVCSACIDELFDPTDRRFLYPFINCTHCGPRYTITRALPYDRPHTSMGSFPMCAECRSEYESVTDRRFHAEPIACPACGPSLSHEPSEMARTIERGGIVALQGIGGFHLVCDANNGAAVQRLRERKARDRKPFAVMVLNAASAEALAFLDDAAHGALSSPVRPIVLSRGRGVLPEAVAPGMRSVGLMLPYAPVHYVLFYELLGAPTSRDWRQSAVGPVLVMTSGNRSGEPLVFEPDDAYRRLSGIADMVVTHDRAIVARADDSVMRVSGGEPVVLRRSRGIAPYAIKLPRDGPSILAVGGDLKNTLCVTRGREAIVSPHVGDLDSALALEAHDEARRHLLQTLEVAPALLVHDLHPDYWTTSLVQRLALPTLAVQHHHAHVAAVAAEHGRTRPLVGLALDGVGYGTDGAAWGGELLYVDGPRFERLGHLYPLRLPGGDRAAREPYRMAASVLVELGRGAEVVDYLPVRAQAGAFASLLASDRLCPRTSSLGRLFDAAAALLRVAPAEQYEGEAAMRLEERANAPAVESGGWSVQAGVLNLLPLMERLIGLDAESGANLFHGTVAAALVAWGVPVCRDLGVSEIAVAGGCAANAVLRRALRDGFAREGIDSLFPRDFPAGDGGISLGQAWVGAAALAGRPASATS